MLLENETMHRSRAELPEPEYLARIGEIAYIVSYLEWFLLGDLDRLKEQLPDDLVLRELEPMTTSQIACAVKSASKRVTDGPVKNYLVIVYRVLFEAAEIRSDLLHARPATHTGLLKV